MLACVLIILLITNGILVLFMTEELLFQKKKKKPQILRKRNNQNFEKEIKFQILKKSYKIKIKIIKIVIFFHFKKILKKTLNIH